jgi:polyferredoxin
LYAAIVHNLATVDGATASIDALCPFGGIETLWRWLTSGGQFVPKTHLANLVLALGLISGVLAAGGAFCGWVCPFGAVQDGLTWARARLRLPELRVPARLDQVLRFGRYLVLGLILYQTINTGKLWFAGYDPYRTLFGLEWAFEFNPAEHWVAYLVTGVVLAASFLMERAWCRYLCPLGGLISFLGNFSLLRIRRNGASCKACGVCERPCPVKLNVATVNAISSNCIGCLACVQACPRHNTLEVQLAPAWLPAPKPRLESTSATD